MQCPSRATRGSQWSGEPALKEPPAPGMILQRLDRTHKRNLDGAPKWEKEEALGSGKQNRGNVRKARTVE